MANPTALPLPFTISHPSVKRVLPRRYGLILLLVFVYFTGFSWTFSRFLEFWLVRWQGFLVSFVALALFIGILIVVIRSISARQGGTKIFVTEQGVRIGKTLIPWHEAELFAIYEIYGQKRSGRAITYELSSATDILRWYAVQRLEDVRQDSAEAVTEYHQQLQALSEIIVARTGLPLSDLRDKQA
ncbi:hypothetical protein [Dictyobacter alpinus]|uniref:hypothetical protein n=1 Tax=Dictyobacter alpinus TaxID=2014873 RepID=UPI000F84A1AA|nr:hypothetical protein [Dictyobacter alpinus]